MLYWIVYALSWIIIPLCQEFENSADFTFTQKLKRAIKRNIIFYLAFAIVGGIFLIYLMIIKQVTWYIVY